jgi:hypothetical protein
MRSVARQHHSRPKLCRTKRVVGFVSEERRGTMITSVKNQLYKLKLKYLISLNSASSLGNLTFLIWKRTMTPKISNKIL